MYKIKNQNKIKGHSSDCTLYSLATITELTYGITVPYGIVEKVVKNAIVDKVLLKFGAYFGIIYKWYCGKIKEATGINMKVKVNQIDNPKFKGSLDSGYAYGLGLIYGNKAYLSAVSRGILTKRDIDKIILQKGGFGHNNVFFKDKEGCAIYEIYKGKRVSCTLEVLEYGVTKGVFYNNTRTIVGNDYESKIVCAYLRQIHFDPDSELIVNSDLDQRALNKASEINKEWKVDFEYGNKSIY